MKNIFYFKEDVRIVTGYYYGIILDALKSKGYNNSEIDGYKNPVVTKLPKDSWFLITSLKSFFYLYIRGYRNFVYWFQGIIPEEDYWRTKSRLRRFCFASLERLAWKKIPYKICVSKYQVEHYNRKYGKVSAASYYVMPCFNAEFHKENFYIPGKYEKNIFCYAGGVQTYQGFDAILKTYKYIESHYKNTILRIYTFDQEKARKLIEAEGIKNYSLDCVSQEQVSKVLSECKFGFLIRDNNIVNQVATPTKLCDYLGNGVIPIITNTVRAYADIAQHYEHLYCFGESNKEQVIDAALTNEVNAADLEIEFKNIMDEYFNPEKFREELCKFFKGL